MTPLQVLAALGLTMSDLSSTMAGSKVFQVLGSIAKTWNTFQTLWSQLPDKPFNIAANLGWSLSKYWSNPGKYLAQIGEQYQVPFQMAQIARRPPSSELGERNYRYDVAITLHFPKTGDIKTMFVTLDEDQLMSQRQLFAEAWERLLRDLKPNTLPPGDEDPLDYFEPSFSLAGFFRLTGA